MIFASIIYPPIVSSHPQVFCDHFVLIPNYNGAHRVGFDGSVWTKKRQIGFGAWVIGTDDDWRQMSLSIDSWGYQNVCLCRDKKQKTFKVCKLVVEAFIGPCPLGMEICHEDGDPGNSHLYNLRYDTPKNNQADRVKHGTDGSGERNSRAFLTWEIVDKMRAEYAAGGVTQTALAVKYNTTQGNIGLIIRNERWV